MNEDKAIALTPERILGGLLPLREEIRPINLKRKGAVEFSWEEGPPLPLTFTITKDVPSYGSNIELTPANAKPGEIRGGDLLWVTSNRSYFRGKTMMVLSCKGNVAEINYLPPLRRRLRAGDQAVIIGRIQKEGD